MEKINIVFMVFLSVVFGHQFQHRIIGGISASKNQFPYQVSVEKQKENIYEHYCGGSIIAPRYILTAAHCIKNNTLRIRAGTMNLNDPSNIGQTVDVHRAFVHPGYNDDFGDIAANDVAVLRLQKRLTFTIGIQPIKLPEPNQEFSGVATLSGWGRTNSLNETYSNHLLYAELHIITLDECKEAFIDASGTYGPLDDNNICTREDGMFGCQGDSGGPLAQNDTVIGVVSFATNPCDIAGSPTAYTNVAKFIGWIKDQQQVE